MDVSKRAELYYFKGFYLRANLKIILKQIKKKWIFLKMPDIKMNR